ncbi:MAG: acyl carrier protein [Paludibacteraceae bacterium]|nr:acyl carrier protein [Paludibacteraceae bacterium]MBP5482189.1 acyl carrier protein [Paludibacteraceae bacterium]
MKTLDEFVVLFAEQLDETDPSNVTAQTKFRELEEWSSLLALSLISMVDEEFDVTLKGDDVKNSETIEDVYNIVVSKK